jgi:hypothetical protein
MVYLSDIEKEAIASDRVGFKHVDGKGITVYGDSSGPRLWSTGRGDKASHRATISKTKLPQSWGLWGAEEVYTKIVDDAQHGKVLQTAEPKRKFNVGSDNPQIIAKDRIEKDRLERAKIAHSPARFESPKVHQSDKQSAPPLKGSATSPMVKGLDSAIEAAKKLYEENKLMDKLPVTPSPSSTAQPPTGYGLPDKEESDYEMLSDAIEDINYLKQKMKGELALIIDSDGYLRGEVIIVKTFGRTPHG